MTKPVGSHITLPQIDTLRYQQKELEHKEDKGKSMICVLHVQRNLPYLGLYYLGTSIVHQAFI